MAQVGMMIKKDASSTELFDGLRTALNMNLIPDKLRNQSNPMAWVEKESRDSDTGT